MTHISQRLGALLTQRNIDDSTYDPEINSLSDAVIYARNKIRTRERRDYAMMGTKFVARFPAKRVGELVGGTAGAAVGTAVGGPGGTGPGAYAGARAGGSAGKRLANMTVNTVARAGRGMKAMYKKARGTRGVNRDRAARFLIIGWEDYYENRTDDDLAYQALDVIFDGEPVFGSTTWEDFMIGCQRSGGLERMVWFVERKLKSTTDDFLH